VWPLSLPPPLCLLRSALYLAELEHGTGQPPQQFLQKQGEVAGLRIAHEILDSIDARFHADRHLLNWVTQLLSGVAGLSEYLIKQVSVRRCYQQPGAGKSGVDQIFFELLDVGCDDALFGERNGIQYADFERDASTYVDAVTSAIRDIESTVRGLRVTRLEPEELVGVSDIALRSGRSRESIRLLAEGQRGPGTFPRPIACIGSNRFLWRWPEVASWLRDVLNEAVDVHRQAAATSAINAVLDFRRYAPAVSDQDQPPLVSWTSDQLLATRSDGPIC